MLGGMVYRIWKMMISIEFLLQNVLVLAILILRSDLRCPLCVFTCIKLSTYCIIIL